MQTTDAGILTDDMQKSERFKVAVNLLRNTLCDAKVQRASKELETHLIGLNLTMRRVVSLDTSLWSRNRMKGCVSWGKFEIGVLSKQILRFFTKQINSRDHGALKQPKNPVIARSKNGFCRLIQDHSDHGASRELISENPYPEWSPRIL